MRKEEHHSSLPSFAGVQEVVHALPGRIRLRIPSLRGNEAGMADYRARLVRLEGVRDVRTNPLLGTVLVAFDPARLAGDIVVAASTRCFDFQAQLQKGEQSSILRELGRFRFALDQAVLKMTHGLVDIHTAMSLSLLVMVVQKLVGRSTSPMSVVNLLWWFLQSIDGRRGGHGGRWA